MGKLRFAQNSHIENSTNRIYLFVYYLIFTKVMYHSSSRQHIEHVCVGGQKLHLKVLRRLYFYFILDRLD